MNKVVEGAEIIIDELAESREEVAELREEVRLAKEFAETQDAVIRMLQRELKDA